MKNTAIAVALLLFGFAFGRMSLPSTALAQTTMPMASNMPMHGMTANCQSMQNTMQHAHSEADRAMMQSMMGMRASMQSMRLTGDADRDFMIMMVPHHQTAIEMAKVELKYGKDQKVIGLAKSIIAAQQREINEMSAWLH